MDNSKAIRYQEEKMDEYEEVYDSSEAEAIEYLINKTNIKYTENGAIGYKSTQRPLLDLSFKVTSLRDMSEKEIVKEFIPAFYDDKEHSIKWLFFLRDILEGLGERRSFRAILKYLAISHTDVCKNLIPYIKDYGRYDDYLVLLDSPLVNEVAFYLHAIIDKDKKNMEMNKPISLLAKWLPSINTSSKETKAYARILIRKWKMNDRTYRKMLAKLRAYSNVLEVKLTKNEWDLVDYSKVPSNANMKYQDAFIKHDNNRRWEYLINALNNNEKINNKTLMPYEITRRMIDKRNGFLKDDLLAEVMWKKVTTEGFDNEWGFDDCIVVADGSGSMYGNVSGSTNVRAIDICNSLAVYFASKLKGIYKDKAITFSENPRLIDMSKMGTLKSKLEKIYSYNECANTNIEAVFDLLLDMAKSNCVPANQIPKQVLVISDMEFDDCARANDRCGLHKDSALFEVIKKRYEDAGYHMPRLIFWNVCGRTNTIPVVNNKEGVCLLSGFSQKTMKIATQKEKKNPYISLCQVLDVPRYNVVWDAVKKVA